MDKDKQISTASGLNVVAGIWLIIAPFVLSYVNQTPKTNDIWLGIIVGVLALIRAFTREAQWLSWINILAGLWLIIAPFVLGYVYTAPKVNDVVMGVIVAALSIWSTAASTSRGQRGRPAAI